MTSRSGPTHTITPGLATFRSRSNGTVAGFDRVHSNNPEENKNKNSFGEDLVEPVAEHVVEEHLVGKCVAENLVAEHVAGEIAAETFVMPALGLLFGLPM